MLQIAHRFASFACFFVMCAGVAIISDPGQAADWPQWRGPLRNGYSAEKGWNSQWGAGGPRKAWAVQVGEGFSSVAVVGGKVYTVGNSANKDTVWCLDSGSGRPVWQYPYPCAPGGNGYSGPRATPTVDGPNVYTLSNDGRAFCLNAANGRLVWMRDLRRDTKASDPTWGFAGSPLILGNLAFYNVGAAGAAVDKLSGRVVWSSGGGPAGYSSPILFDAGGKPGVSFFVAAGLVGVDPQTGRKLWQQDWNTPNDVNAADPIFFADSVFISANYNHGCALIRLAGGRPSVLWENRNMRNHFNTCILAGSAFYGNDDNTLKCIDVRTGADKWQNRGIGKGGLIISDGKLIVLSERGELIVAAANPDRYTELARAQVMSGGTSWAHPVLANGFIYCRSHEGELVCVDVRRR